MVGRREAVGIKAPRGKKPYAGSAVPIERSKQQISQLLRDYGAEGVNWSDNFSTGEVQLRFVVRKDDGTAIGFKIVPAAFREKHSNWDPMKGKHVVTEAPDWPRSMRLLLAWIKTKLESIAFGLTAVEEEFLAQRLVRDAVGREVTVGDLVLPAIESSGGRLALEAPKSRDEAVESEAREMG